MMGDSVGDVLLLFELELGVLLIENFTRFIIYNIFNLAKNIFNI
jgi:hypothetical protein